MFEEQLSQGIITFIEDEGYIPFLEIPHFSGKIDFLGINSSECLVIESKVSKWNDALKQAIRYGYGAERAYVALPAPTAGYVLNNFKEKFEFYGIGLIQASENSAIVLLKCKRKKASPIFKQILLEQARNRVRNSNSRVDKFIMRYRQ